MKLGKPVYLGFIYVSEYEKIRLKRKREEEPVWKIIKKCKDFVFADAMVRGAEKRLIGRERLDKLIYSKGSDEAIKLLYDVGYGEEGEEQFKVENFEKLLVKEQKKPMNLLKVSPQK